MGASLITLRPVSVGQCVRLPTQSGAVVLVRGDLGLQEDLDDPEALTEAESTPELRLGPFRHFRIDPDSRVDCNFHVVIPRGDCDPCDVCPTVHEHALAPLERSSTVGGELKHGLDSCEVSGAHRQSTVPVDPCETIDDSEVVGIEVAVERLHLQQHLSMMRREVLRRYSFRRHATAES